MVETQQVTLVQELKEVQATLSKYNNHASKVTTLPQSTNIFTLPPINIEPDRVLEDHFPFHNIHGYPLSQGHDP